MARGPRVIAHRGVHSGAATENTMRAFELALEAGADMVELDVRRSGDSQLAILHDPAQADVELASCSLDEFGGRTGFRPPLLEDALAWAAGRIALDVELKEEGYAEQVVPLLEGFVAAGGELLVTSFLAPVVAAVSELSPSLQRGLLLEYSAADAAERALAAGAATVLPKMDLMTDALVEEVSAAGLSLIVWDFLAAADASWLADPRLHGVITDDVPGALAARAALSA